MSQARTDAVEVPGGQTDFEMATLRPSKTQLLPFDKMLEKIPPDLGDRRWTRRWPLTLAKC
jgi:hypothetical protein